MYLVHVNIELAWEFQIWFKSLTQERGEKRRWGSLEHIFGIFTFACIRLHLGLGFFPLYIRLHLGLGFCISASIRLHLGLGFFSLYIRLHLGLGFCISASICLHLGLGFFSLYISIYLYFFNPENELLRWPLGVKSCYFLP